MNPLANLSEQKKKFGGIVLVFVSCFEINNMAVRALTLKLKDLGLDSWFSYFQSEWPGANHLASPKCISKIGVLISSHQVIMMVK